MSRVWLFELLRICEEPVSCCRPMAAIFLLETSLPFPDSNYRPLIVSQKLMKAPIKWLRVPSCRRPAYIFRPKLFLAFTDCLFQSWTRHMACSLAPSYTADNFDRFPLNSFDLEKSSKSWAHKVRVFGPFTLSAPKSRDLKNIGRGKFNQNQSVDDESLRIIRDLWPSSIPDGTSWDQNLDVTSRPLFQTRSIGPIVTWRPLESIRAASTPKW